MKVLGFLGFGLGIVAFVLAIINLYELLPFADSIAHLEQDPYYSLWINAVELSKNVAVTAIVISALALIISVVYYFKERKKLYVFSVGFSAVALLISFPLYI